MQPLSLSPAQALSHGRGRPKPGQQPSGRPEPITVPLLSSTEPGPFRQGRGQDRASTDEHLVYHCIVVLLGLHVPAERGVPKGAAASSNFRPSAFIFCISIKK